MKRVSVQKRPNWEQTNKELGMDFNFVDNDIYWDEGVAYEFTSKEIDNLEKATNELNDMCLLAVEHVIANDKFHLLLGLIL